MIRFMVKLFALALILALVAPFLPVWKGGRPLLTLDDLKWPEGLPSADLEVPRLGGGRTEPVIIYKWRDTEGQIHFSNEPPPDGVLFERVEVDPNANSIPAVRAPAPETDSSPSLYSPEGIERLTTEARGVEDSMQDRARRIEEITDSR